MKAYERLIKYVKFNTKSSHDTGTHPSTGTQFALAEALKEELISLGCADARISADCYVYASLEATAGYAAWLGDWTITGANGITQNVTFSKGKTNETFIMTGYEGPEAEGLNVTVEWIEEEGCWAIYNQELGTADFGQYGTGNIWFIGEGENEEVYLSELPICIGGMFEDGSLGAIGFETELEFQDGSTQPYKVVMMEFLGYLPEAGGALTYITTTYKTGYPTFPMTFTPATKATTCSVSEFKPVKKSLNSLAPKTFKTYGLREMSYRAF